MPEVLDVAPGDIVFKERQRQRGKPGPGTAAVRAVAVALDDRAVGFLRLLRVAGIGLARGEGEAPFTMFEFSSVGAIVAAVKFAEKAGVSVKKLFVEETEKGRYLAAKGHV